MSNYSNYEATKEIIQRISKKIPQGIMIGNTTVGHIEWQMYLMRDYLKLDGTPLANASNDYDELLKFAQDNSLITSDTTDKSLFKYDSTNDVLTLPDYIGLCLQGGNTVEEKEAGLPNITGDTAWVSSGTVSTMAGNHFGNGAFDAISSFRGNAFTAGSLDWVGNLTFDASLSNPIYGNSTTVQPPAITLIPQIKYKKATVYEGIQLGENYSTEEKRIGTWIDGKPLYQKTYSGTVPSGADSTNTNIFSDSVIGNIDNGFISNGCIFNSTYNLIMPINFVDLGGSNTTTSSVFISRSQNSIRGMIRSLYIGEKIVVTIQYTKTTD